MIEAVEGCSQIWNEPSFALISGQRKEYELFFSS